MIRAIPASRDACEALGTRLGSNSQSQVLPLSILQRCSLADATIRDLPQDATLGSLHARFRRCTASTTRPSFGLGSHGLLPPSRHSPSIPRRRRDAAASHLFHECVLTLHALVAPFRRLKLSTGCSGLDSAPAATLCASSLFYSRFRHTATPQRRRYGWYGTVRTTGTCVRNPWATRPLGDSGGPDCTPAAMCLWAPRLSPLRFCGGASSQPDFTTLPRTTRLSGLRMRDAGAPRLLRTARRSTRLSQPVLGPPTFPLAFSRSRGAAAAFRPNLRADATPVSPHTQLRWPTTSATTPAPDSAAILARSHPPFRHSATSERLQDDVYGTTRFSSSLTRNPGATRPLQQPEASDLAPTVALSAR